MKIQTYIVLYLLIIFGSYTVSAKITCDEKTSFNSIAGDQLSSNLVFNEVVLVDMRRIGYITANPDKISNGESRAILKYLFGRNREIAETATVARRVQGAFTKREKNQTLYYVNGGYDDSAAGRYQTSSTSWIVVYQGTTPIFKNKVYSNELVKMTDINNDGIDEFMLSDGFTGTGSTTSTNTLYQIRGNKLEKIISAGYSDSCGSVGQDLTQEAEVVFYTPSKSNSFPSFRSEYYTRKCSSRGLWKKLRKNPFNN